MRVAPSTRAELISVDDQVRAARIELLLGAGQVPAFPAMLGQGGEALQEGEVTLGELLKDLYQDISSVPRLPPLTVPADYDGADSYRMLSEGE